MKKPIVLLLLIAILASMCVAFVACNDDTITVTIIARSYGIKSEETYTLLKKHIGDTITFEDYTAVSKQYISFSSWHEAGFYLDSECVYKRDDSILLDGDITLYVKRQPSNTPEICFILDGEQYNIVTTNNKEITAFDFIISAYGKHAIPDEFEFFKDEAMTIPLELEGFNYKECYRDIYNTYKIYVKKSEVRLFKLNCLYYGYEHKEPVVLLNVEKPLDDNMVVSLFYDIPQNGTIEYFADEDKTISIATPKDVLDTNQSEIPTIYFSITE